MFDLDFGDLETVILLKKPTRSPSRPPEPPALPFPLVRAKPTPGASESDRRHA